MDRATLLSFFHDHHVRSQARIDERIHAIKSAIPLTDDLAVIRPNQLLVLALPYDKSTYLNALKRRGSPLLTSIAATAKDT